MIKITIDGYFHSLNEYIEAIRQTRGRWNGGNRMKQNDQRDIIFSLQGQLRRKLKTPITIDYVFYCKDKKRDLDNVSGYFHKVFQDALVECGRLENDSWRFITGFSDTFKLDRKYPRIEITIHEKGDK